MPEKFSALVKYVSSHPGDLDIPTFFRSFGRSHAPNEQFFWPETAQHDVGWLIQVPKDVDILEL